MILTGDPFDARRAAEVGLVNRVVDEGQALEAAMGLAEKIAANGPLALMASKEISNGGGDWTAEERWDEMARVMRPVFTSRTRRKVRGHTANSTYFEMLPICAQNCSRSWCQSPEGVV